MFTRFVVSNTVVLLLSALADGQPLPVAPPGSNATFTVSNAPLVHGVHVTMSLQSGMARALSGLNLNGYSATLCSSDGQGVSIGGGSVLQLAERAGLQVLNLHVAEVAATQARAKSNWEVFGVTTEELLFDVGMIAALNIVKVNPAKTIGKVWRAAPLLLGRKIASLNAERSKIQPDAIALFGSQMLDPTVMYVIPTGMGVCIQRLLLSSPGGPASLAGEIVL